MTGKIRRLVVGRLAWPTLAAAGLHAHLEKEEAA